MPRRRDLWVEDARGGSGDDVITGDGGATRLSGGAGDDVLRGRVGDDVLRGDAGADVFVIDAGARGSERIVDRDPAEDRIPLVGISDAPELRSRRGGSVVDPARDLPNVEGVVADSVRVEALGPVSRAWPDLPSRGSFSDLA